MADQDEIQVRPMLDMKDMTEEELYYARMSACAGTIQACARTSSLSHTGRSRQDEAKLTVLVQIL
jgi:hypothetical protein